MHYSELVGAKLATCKALYCDEFWRQHTKTNVAIRKQCQSFIRQRRAGYAATRLCRLLHYLTFLVIFLLNNNHEMNHILIVWSATRKLVESGVGRYADLGYLWLQHRSTEITTPCLINVNSIL